MGETDFTKRESNMAERSYSGKELQYLREVLASGRLSSLVGGTYARRFEEEFARMIGVPHAAAVSSGMAALHASLLSAGIGSGDEVICDSVFVFGAIAVLYCNALPVFVDIDPVTQNMRPEGIEPAVTSRTKAIIVTHAWGLPAEMDRILEVARAHRLIVIEDCAESVLATYKGRCTGSWGDVGCFSFQASKQLSLGDGGMVSVANEGLIDEVRKHGGAPTWKSTAYSLDFNYRMNELSAAVGLAQLEALPETVRRLRKNAAHFDAAVEGRPWLRLQRGPAEAEHSFYHWVATFDGEQHGIGLPEFLRAIDGAGLSSVSIGYTKIPAYKHPAIAKRLAHAFHCPANEVREELYPDGLCPVAEKVIPRTVMAYLFGPEERFKREAESLHQVIVKIETGAGDAP